MKTRSHALVLAFGALGALVAASCTADLNDTDQCYAVAQAYCAKVLECDPAFDAGPGQVGDAGTDCTSQLYYTCSSNKGAGSTLGISNVRSCISAVNGTACGTAPGNACGNDLGQALLPASSSKGTTKPDGGSIEGGTGPMDSAAIVDSTVMPPFDSGQGPDTGSPPQVDSSAPACSGNCGTFLVSDGPGSITELAVSDSQVYWVSPTNDTNVRTFDKSGATTFGQGIAPIQGLIATSVGVAWIANGTAFGQSAASGSPVSLLVGNQVSALAAESSSGGWVYGLGTTEVYSGSTEGSLSLNSPFSGSYSAIGGDAVGTFAVLAETSDVLQVASGGVLAPVTLDVSSTVTQIAVCSSIDEILTLSNGTLTSVSTSGMGENIAQGVSQVAGSGSTAAWIESNGSQVTVASGSLTSTTTLTVLGQATAVAVGGGTAYWATSTGDIYEYP